MEKQHNLIDKKHDWYCTISIQRNEGWQPNDIEEIVVLCIDIHGHFDILRSGKDYFITQDALYTANSILDVNYIPQLFGDNGLILLRFVR